MRRVVLVAGVALIGLVAGGVWWVAHVEAITFVGTGGGGSVMKRLATPGAEAYVSDPPPTFGWHSNQEITYSWLFHNTLSVPITITGADFEEMQGTNQLSAPSLYQPKPGVSYAQTLKQAEPLHSLRVPAHSDRDILIIWHTRGDCDVLSRAGANASQLFSAINLRYTLLGVIHKSQWVNLYIPDDSTDNQYLFGLQYPTSSLCPNGYPLTTHKRTA